MRRSRRWRGLIAWLLAATVSMSAAPALAQDATLDVTPDVTPDPSPQPSGSAVAQLQGDLAFDFPEELGGRPWQQLSVVTGHELIAGLDPTDVEDAARIAENQKLLQATGAEQEDLTSVTGFRIEDDGAFSFVNAYQIAGADPSVMVDVVQERFIASYAEAMQEPRMDIRQIAGRVAVALWDETLTDSGGDVRPNYVHTSGDTVWVITVDDSLLGEVFEALPQDNP